MTHCAYRSRVGVGHPTATGPVTSTCLHDRWGRAEATQTALGEALVLRRRTRVRFPPPPPTHKGSPRKAGFRLHESGAREESAGEPPAQPCRARWVDRALHVSVTASEGGVRR